MTPDDLFSITVRVYLSLLILVFDLLSLYPSMHPSGAIQLPSLPVLCCLSDDRLSQQLDVSEVHTAQAQPQSYGGDPGQDQSAPWM
jgi:hypothetical protein